MKSEIFQERLKTLRLSKQHSLESLGKIVGMSRGSLSALESGKRSVSLDSLILLADALETSLDYLVGRIDDPVPGGMLHSDFTYSLQVESYRQEDGVAFWIVFAATTSFRNKEVKSEIDTFCEYESGQSKPILNIYIKYSPELEKEIMNMSTVFRTDFENEIAEHYRKIFDFDPSAKTVIRIE